ncbi:MAG: RNA-binding S4 domain-containing protein [Pseudomonadota bacterium]
MEQMEETNGKMRVDKWLWAARFFKTRSIAVDAVESGKVTMDGARIKPAKTVGIGDLLVIRLGPYQHEVEVLGLSNKRGPAPVAQQLYRETEQSKTKRAIQAEQHKLLPQSDLKGRPTKRDRREIARFVEGGRPARNSAWGDFD